MPERSCRFEKCHGKGLCNWKFNLEKLQLESTFQLFVYILDASNVVNGVPLEYVTLHAINYSLKEAEGLKSVTKRVYVTEYSTLNN